MERIPGAMITRYHEVSSNSHRGRLQFQIDLVPGAGSERSLTGCTNHPNSTVAVAPKISIPASRPALPFWIQFVWVFCTSLAEHRVREPRRLKIGRRRLGAKRQQIDFVGSCLVPLICFDSTNPYLFRTLVAERVYKL